MPNARSRQSREAAGLGETPSRRQKSRFRVEGRQSGNRFLGRGRLGRREQPAHESFHQSGNACGSVIDRAILGTFRIVCFSRSAQTFSVSGHQPACRVGFTASGCRSRAARPSVLERRRGRHGPARARPSRWAARGRARSRACSRRLSSVRPPMRRSRVRTRSRGLDVPRATTCTCVPRCLETPRRCPYTAVFQRPSAARSHIACRMHGNDLKSPEVSSCLWKKSSMTFFHEVDRRKRRGFPGSTSAASGGGRLYLRAASGLKARSWDREVHVHF